MESEKSELLNIFHSITFYTATKQMESITATHVDSHTISLPSLTTTKVSIPSEEILMRKEQCRIGTMIVRFSQLKLHPKQRPFSIQWVNTLADSHFENGNNLQKAAFPLVVLAVGRDPVEAVSIENKISRAPEDREFLLVSGQHRVAAMKMIIRSRLQFEQKNKKCSNEDIMAAEDAEWPALVYSQSEYCYHFFSLK
jgi:hypothetical protein